MTKEPLTWENCPMNRLGELVQQRARRAKKDNEQRIQRVLAVLPKERRADFVAILEYYRNELGLANYAADRQMNPENY